jgi:addiction module HigA family antidote
MKTNKLPPIHPGEILREEFMKPRGLSQNALARALNVPPRRINEIVLEKRGITADTALRLARYFGTSAEMWTGLQADYDLRLVRYEKARAIEREVEPLALLRPVTRRRGTQALSSRASPKTWASNPAWNLPENPP